MACSVLNRTPFRLLLDALAQENHLDADWMRELVATNWRVRREFMGEFFRSGKNTQSQLIHDVPWISGYIETERPIVPATSF